MPKLPHHQPPNPNSRLLACVADFYEFLRGEVPSSAYPCYFLNGSLHWIGVIKLHVDAVTNKGRYHGALGVIAGDHIAQVLRAAWLMDHSLRVLAPQHSSTAVGFPRP
ncbi:hypothetical protein Acr_17g0013090 [Actinidia rufa]|uniref:Uncharacterized protein n=1 Tax=Actinidia rufa TaxID=165716 RepID=A0A7J0G4Q0_9ERIC|nr:hypothetical protein Acr_17g0013090 [Actinidia rufa]